MLPLQCHSDKELFKVMKTKDLIKRLRDAGCVLSRHGGSHDKWTNPKTGISQFVPRHSGEVPTGLADKLLKDLVGA